MIDEIGEEEYNEVKDWCKDIATQVIFCKIPTRYLYVIANAKIMHS